MAKDKDKMKKSEKIRLAAEIYEMMLDGDPDRDIIETLNISAEEFTIAKRFLLTHKGQLEASLSREERFARYQITQEQNVVDLNSLITNLNSKSQYNALVGAIRLRADIANKSIEMGQTLGVIEKQADRREISIGGIIIGDLPDKELKDGVVAAFKGLGGLMDRYGQGTNLKDIKVPAELHSGDKVAATVIETTAVTGAPEMKDPAKGKRNKAKTGKRHAGRRRVKG